MPKNNRDDFRESTKLQVAKKAGWLCCYPTCGRSTVGATIDGKDVIMIGTAAHICAAAPGGPRYDETMTTEERRSAENGIWMCRNHGTAVDSKDSEFTAENLRAWRTQGEQEARRRVLDNDMPPARSIANGAPSHKKMRLATRSDLDVFRRTDKWPRTTVALTLDVCGFERPLTTLELARTAASFDDLILVAPPGMGKTTTLLQIAENLVSESLGNPVIVPLGEWATEKNTILESVLKRPAFRDVDESEFREAATLPGTMLLLDGWNELDFEARKRARSEVSTLKAEMPELGLIVSTRRQVLDIPFSGTRVDLLPLSSNQQMQIARSMKGEKGANLVDQAWRTSGVRDLVSVPLYLQTLLSLSDDQTFPTTKEEVLGNFVGAHEHQVRNAEALYETVRGFHTTYLDNLALRATLAANTTLADSEARLSIFQTGSKLADSGQIIIRPEPEAVLNVLVSNHVLMRAGDTAGYSFQHQQFQEWYASHEVQTRIMEGASDTNARLRLKAQILDWPAWEESILFAVERLARGSHTQRSACGTAILTAFEVDPMLAAEMIFRATDDVWHPINSDIYDRVREWHTPGQIDRAFRFMLTCGRPEFFNLVWPTISNVDQQIGLKGLRHCDQFRPTILGDDPKGKIVSLPPNVRATLLHEIAAHSGMDGMNLATSIANKDSDATVQVAVIEALSFRRADRHVADILRNALPKTLEIVALRGLADDVEDENLNAALATMRAASADTIQRTSERLRRIAFDRASSDHGPELRQIISSIDISQRQDTFVQLIHEAHRRYPRDVALGLLERVRNSQSLFYGADDLLAGANLEIDDADLIELVLEDSQRHDERAAAAASVLGKRATGIVLQAYFEATSKARASARPNEKVWDNRNTLSDRLRHVPGRSLVGAIRDRSKRAGDKELSDMAELIAHHPQETSSSRSRPFDAECQATIQALVTEWGNRLLRSDKATRSEKAHVAQAARRAPSDDLLSILSLLLADNLKRLRAFRERRRLAGRSDEEAWNEASWPLTHEYQYAFLANKTDATAELMKTYLDDADFGALAAEVLADQWRVYNEPLKTSRLGGGVDFSGVRTKRQSLLDGTDINSDQADAIFQVVDRLVAEETSEAEKKLALELGIVAAAIPHGRWNETTQKLIPLGASRARASLLLNLILSGEEVGSKLVFEGIENVLQEAKQSPWMISEREGYPLRAWLRLVPFVDHPMEVWPTIETLPAEQRSPEFLREMLRAFLDSPSDEVEDILFLIAEQNPRFYRDNQWQATAFGLGTLSAARRIVDLIAVRVIASGSADIWLTREVSGIFKTQPDVRRHVYQTLQLETLPAGVDVLITALLEVPDEEGLLLLLQLEHRLKRKIVKWQTLKAIVTQDVPSEDWRGAFETVPVSSAPVRKALLLSTSDGGPEDAAARWLGIIDEIRDDYGTLETEPRHPDLGSGRPWPINRA